MKRILYIHQYFLTPEEGGAIRSYHIAKGMVDRNMEVDMITTHNKPVYEVKQIDGIKVHYLPIAYSSEFSFRKRAFAFVKFMLYSLKLIKKLPPPDLVYATSTPLTVGIMALWLHWRQKLNYVFEVRDLWPEAPIQLKIIRSKLTIKLAELLEKKIYKNAVLIIALSPGIAQGIRGKYPKANAVLIPNMSDPDFFANAANQPSERQYLTIGYFGAFGISNHLNSVLDIAMACQEEHLPVRFVLVGQGPLKGSIEASARKRGIDSIALHPHLDRFGVRHLMQSIDAVLVSFKNIPVLHTNSPNKFFDGLAAGKLIIVNTPGWLKTLVEDHRCGFYTNQEKPEAFPDLIKPFISDPTLLASYQKRARLLAEEQFSKDRLVHHVCKLVENI